MDVGSRAARRSVRRRGCALALVLLAVDGCSSASDTRLPDIQAMRCAKAAAPPRQPSSRPALLQIAAEENAPLQGAIDHSGHGRAGPQSPIEVHGAIAEALASGLRAAAQIACELRTPADAQRAGYGLSAYFTEGIGTHWTNWRLVDEPFDPARPSMLLYGPHLGETQLVGFSYWVRTSDPSGPAGFAGPADRWHRHYGMCFDRTGLLQREDVRSPTLCSGVYLNGSDMWMLHAWIVPGDANVWGVFAPLNPQLCSRTVADINRCPGIGGA